MDKFLRRLFGRREDLTFQTPQGTMTAQYRGSQARQALANEILMEAFEQLRAEAMEVWKRTSAHDVEAREFLWKQVRALDLVRARLQRYVSDAVYEEAAQKRRGEPGAIQ